MRNIAILLGIFCAGCSTSNVLQTGADSFTVSSHSLGVSPEGVKRNVYQSANEFCESRNQVMVETSVDVIAGSPGRNAPSADLRFRCLPAGSPEIYRRASGVQAIAITGENGGLAANPTDKYARLKQLKELLDSGALNQSEFDVEKAKILNEK